MSENPSSLERAVLVEVHHSRLTLRYKSKRTYAQFIIGLLKRCECINWHQDVEIMFILVTLNNGWERAQRAGTLDEKMIQNNLIFF